MARLLFDGAIQPLAEIAMKRPPERLAHGAARAVATDHETGSHGLQLSVTRGINALERDRNRVFWRLFSPLGFASVAAPYVGDA